MITKKRETKTTYTVYLTQKELVRHLLDMLGERELVELPYADGHGKYPPGVSVTFNVINEEAGSPAYVTGRGVKLTVEIDEDVFHAIQEPTDYGQR